MLDHKLTAAATTTHAHDTASLWPRSSYLDGHVVASDAS
jgi:hypothetical protein